MVRMYFYSSLYAALRFIDYLFKRFLAAFYPHAVAGIPSLVTISRDAPAAVRSFWTRITARSDDPVPRTA